MQYYKIKKGPVLPNLQSLLEEITFLLKEGEEKEITIQIVELPEKEYENLPEFKGY